MNLPEDFVFSQGSLQDYADCPRRFELRYLMRQRWPAPEVDDMLEFEALAEQGQQFHHLVHQHLAGIPADVLVKYIEDDTLRRWFDCYLQNGLEDVPPRRHPEITLTVALGQAWLLAKFDLVALLPGQQALIVDWKTSRRMPRRDWLAQRLQTIVYRYVLAQGGEFLNQGQPIAPEQIEMVYWYADHAGAVHRLPYDAAQFQADHAALLRMVQEIATRPDFPLTDDVRHCRFCVYRSLCDRGTTAGPLEQWEAEDYEGADLSDFTLDIDEIGEIEF